MLNPKDPASRAAWVHGQPMAPCPKCGSYDMKPQMPIQMALTGDETAPLLLGKWARATKAGAGKTSAAKRRVPLMPYAREIAATMKACPSESGTLFGVTTAQVDALFRKARDRCGIENLHFHDSRANAITMLARHMDILDLARAIGHSDLKKLMVYYRKTAEDIAATLPPSPGMPR